MVKLVTNACADFIEAGYSYHEDHAADLHIYSFCLVTVHRQCATPKDAVEGSNMLAQKQRERDAVCQAHLPLDNDSDRITNMDSETDLIPSYFDSLPWVTMRPATFIGPSVNASAQGGG